MTTTLFLQSEMQDPYGFYETMLSQNPVYWDETNQIWALYSYEGCAAILSSSAAHIPEINPNNEQGLNERALQISEQLARLSNGIQHDVARETALLLFSKMNPIATNEILEQLLVKDEGKCELDWVNSVCKQLPVLAVLKSFDFDDQDCRFISDTIEQFTKIMLPNKTREQLESINVIANEIYAITERQLDTSGFYNVLVKTLSEKHQMGEKEIMSLCVSNLIGLFIQSYDAGRGLLSNSLLQILNGDAINSAQIQSAVVESLRFDPPIHTTRRVAVEDIVLNDTVIKKGDKILLVLAAANRDPKQFSNPNTFDIARTNNNEHLTFGIGGHGCLAKHFSVRLATDALQYLFGRHKSVRLLDRKIAYEPLSNARLPQNILISFE